MTKKMKIPILGQEAICPDGLGRVTAYCDKFPEQWVQVSTYVEDLGCKWAPHNVELIDPRRRCTMYVYIRSEPQLWTVGFYSPDGHWQPESDHPSANQAASRVAYLNGGENLGQHAPGEIHSDLTIYRGESLTELENRLANTLARVIDERERRRRQEL